MKRFVFWFLVFGFCGLSLQAQTPVYPVKYTVATLPAAATMRDRVVKIHDSRDGGCTSGSGSLQVWCLSTGSAWVPLPDTRQNKTYEARWWTEATVTVPGSSTAPSLIVGTFSPGGNSFTNTSTYQVACAYQVWSGITGLSPTASFTAKNKQGIAVKCPASLSNNSKYAVGFYVYISPNGGTNWYQADSVFQRPGLGSFGDDVALWGGVPFDYNNGTSGAAPPAGGTTATTPSGIVVSPPASAPTLTNLGAMAAGTYYAAFAYLTGDGTETALSPVSSGLALAEGNYLRIQRTVEPPSGAVAIRLYVGTSSTPSSLHLQKTVPLHHVTADLHEYDSAGAAPSAGTAQSAISNLQQAYDAMMDTGSVGTIIATTANIKTPLILRYKNSGGTPVQGITIKGDGTTHGAFFGGPQGLTYTGTQTNNVVGIMVSTSNLTWDGIDLQDTNHRLIAGLAGCDYFGGGGFVSQWYRSIIAGTKAGVGATGYQIAVQSAGNGSHTTSEQHFYEVVFGGAAWGIDVHGGQTFDLQFHNCGFYSDSEAGSAASGMARIGAPVYLDKWEGSGPVGIGYGLFLTSDLPHPYYGNPNVWLSSGGMDANAGSPTSYVHASAQAGYPIVSLRDSILNTSIADHYALYTASPIIFNSVNTVGGGHGWINFINRYDAANSPPIVNDSDNLLFGLGATYKFKVSPTSDVGNGINKQLLARVNIGGYRLHNDGATVTKPAQITSNQNDYNPTGTAYLQTWWSDASRDVTGLVLTYDCCGSHPPTNGERHEIWNVGSFNIVLKHESASSGAGNRFTNSTGADVVIEPGERVSIFYDGVTSRWRVDATIAVVDADQAVNAQTGTSYTIVAGDNGKFLLLSNASSIAVSLPQATGSFTTGWTIDVGAIGAGTATITPTTSTIDATRVGGTGAQSSLAIASGKSVRLVSNGTNYVAYNYQGRF